MTTNTEKSLKEKMIKIEECQCYCHVLGDPDVHGVTNPQMTCEHCMTADTEKSLKEIKENFRVSVISLFDLEGFANDNLANLITNNFEYYADSLLSQAKRETEIQNEIVWSEGFIHGLKKCEQLAYDCVGGKQLDEAHFADKITEFIKTSRDDLKSHLINKKDV